MSSTSQIANKHLTATLNKTTLPEHLHLQAFNNSFQANIIFGSADGHIISVNRSACKLLGYSKKELLTKNRIDLFDTNSIIYKRWLKEKKKEGRAKANLSLIKKSGKLIACAVTSVEFNDERGEASSIMSIEDITDRIREQEKIDEVKEKATADQIAMAQIESENRLAQNTDWIKSITKVSYDVIWDWDIIANQITFGKGYELVFGYRLPSNKMLFDEWISFFPSEDVMIIQKKLTKIFSSGKKNWKETYQFTCSDGSVRQVITRANLLRNNDLKVIRMIGVIRDLSQIQQLEETLEQAANVKERAIIEAIVEAKEMERSDIGKELHDNINQLLGASILYLDMARSDTANADIYLTHSTEYIKNAIAEIRSLSKGLTADILKDFGLCEAINHVTRDIMQIKQIKIKCFLDEGIETEMSEAFKLNTFRIVQEQLNNILKHAGANEIQISLSTIKKGFILSIGDDGRGFDTAIKSTGIGISNILSRAKLYKGNAHFNSSSGKGCMVVIDFPNSHM